MQEIQDKSHKAQFSKLLITRYSFSYRKWDRDCFCFFTTGQKFAKSHSKKHMRPVQKWFR